eukprot:9490936-Pyramimonas_sp.AAC.1
MLYWWSAESIQKCDGKSESTEVVSAAEMSSSAYDQVRQAMLDTAVGGDSSLSRQLTEGGSSKRSKKHPKTAEQKAAEQKQKEDIDKQLTVEERRRKQAVQELDTILKSAKAWCKDGGTS